MRLAPILALLAVSESCTVLALAESPVATPAPTPQSRVAEALDDLGKRTTTSVVDGFVIASPPPGDTTGASAIAKQALRAFFNGRFSTPPREEVLVYLFPSARPYQAYCKKRWDEPCISIYGFYLGDERRIVLNVGPGVGTLTHELVHPIMRADLPAAPTWIDEGIASLYEGFSLGKPGQIRGVKNWRLPRLKAGLANKKEASDATISALFGMSDEAFRNEREDLHYALARYFALWMEQKDWLWNFYHAWRDNVGSDPTGEKAFVATTGRTPAEWDKDWQRWLRNL